MRTHRFLAAATATALLALTACSAQVVTATSSPSAPVAASPTPSPSPVVNSRPTPSPKPSATGSTVPVVPGYGPGVVPDIPMFVVPDLSVLSDQQKSIQQTLTDAIGTVTGLTVSAAHCNADGSINYGTAGLSLYGDGSGTYIGPDGEVWNYGDGSGSLTGPDGEVWNYGDGSGSYTSGTLEVWNYGDGSGSYTDATGSTWLYGDGSGSITTPDSTLWNYGDGSGSYSAPGVEIFNYGDGTASYKSASLDIHNWGDGTATVNGVTITGVPAAVPLAPLGTFPPLAALLPTGDACGTLITVNSAVLFDSDKFDIRPDAQAVLAAVASALAPITGVTLQIHGHTDYVDTDDYNQILSENRADSVIAYLQTLGVTLPMTAVGFGEAHPVAPNEINGVPNPPGMQQNRRVEIFIPNS